MVDATLNGNGHTPAKQIQAPTVNSLLDLQKIFKSEAKERAKSRFEIMQKAVGAVSTLNLGESLMPLRSELLRFLMDGTREINADCGYPDWLTPFHYQAMYDRNGIARRVVDCEPEETWAMDPEIYEDEDPETKTKFEKAVADFNEKWNIFHHLLRIDILSGIGQYGVLLMGIDDGLGLQKAVEGINDDGTSDGGNDYKLLYLRPFDESVVFVKLRETDTTSPRYGLPKMYTIHFRDFPNWGIQAGEIIARDVHWTRVLHVADNLKMSPIYGVPRMQPVYDRLYDLRKIYSANGEAFWKGAFPGISFEVNPELADQGIEMDKDSIKKQMDEFANGTQRYIATTGVSAKTIPPMVVDPSPSVKTQLQSIAICKGIPYRVLFGSEEAKLAGEKDSEAWNKRLGKRQNKYVTPLIIRPFYERMIAFGILPEPNGMVFKVDWPDLDSPDDATKAQTGLVRTQAFAAYTEGGVAQLVPPKPYMVHILGMTNDEADSILDAAQDFNEENNPPDDGGDGTGGDDSEQESSGDEGDLKSAQPDDGNALEQTELTSQKIKKPVGAQLTYLPSLNSQGPHKFASTQINLPLDIANAMMSIGRSIPEEDLAEDGVEQEPHVTIKYGLHSNDPQETEFAVDGFGSIPITMGSLSLFSATKDHDFDVLKVSVASPKLHRLFKRLKANVENTEKYPKYVPHATIAYLKAGTGEKYLRAWSKAGHTFDANTVVFSASDGKRTNVSLNSQSQTNIVPQLALNEEGDNRRPFVQGGISHNFNEHHDEHGRFATSDADGEKFLGGWDSNNTRDLKIITAPEHEKGEVNVDDEADIPSSTWGYWIKPNHGVIPVEATSSHETEARSRWGVSVNDAMKNGFVRIMHPRSIGQSMPELDIQATKSALVKQKGLVRLFIQKALRGNPPSDVWVSVVGQKRKEGTFQIKSGGDHAAFWNKLTGQAVVNFNPNHDQQGRFAETDEAGGVRKLITDTGWFTGDKPQTQSNGKWQSFMESKIHDNSSFYDTRVVVDNAHWSGAEANRIATTFKTVQEHFGPIGHIKEFDTMPLEDKHVLAETSELPGGDMEHPPGSGRLSINSDLCRRPGQLDDACAAGARKGIIVGRNGGEVLAHEFGHVIQNNSLFFRPEQYGGSSLACKYLDEHDPPKGGLSRYGEMTTTNEKWAECVAVCLTRKPSEMTHWQKGFLKEFNKDIVRAGGKPL